MCAVRFGFTIAAVLLAGISVAAQQPSATKKPSPQAKTSAKAAAPEPSLRETILERAHLAMASLPPEERSTALAGLTGVAADYKSPHLREWAEELFQSANSLSGEAKRRTQAAAVNAMTQLDPARAAAMLSQMEPDEIGDADNHPTPAYRAMAAQRLIEVVSFRFKEASVPVIRQIANSLGQSGGYPYAAIGDVLGRMGKANPETSESLYRDALAAYRQDSSPDADQDFARFLMPLTTVVARPSLKEGYDLLVRNILEHGDSGAPVQFSSGATMTRGEYQLRQLLPVLRSVDPELAAELPRDHPNLARASTGTPVPASQVHMRNVEAANDRQAAALGHIGDSSDAERGAELLLHSDDPKMLAQAMPDVEVRAIAFAQAAQMERNHDVAKARSYLQQGFSLAGQLDDPHAHLRALSEIAWSADAVPDMQIRRQAIQEAFPIAERLVRDEVDDQGHFKPGEAAEALGRLVQLGMETDPDATLIQVDAVPIPALKVNLLIGAANAALPPPAKSEKASR